MPLLFFINNMRIEQSTGDPMSLYGNTDSDANVTKAGRGIAASSQAKQTIFIDDTEAALAENKSRGLNAPGWWSYYTYTDCEGNTRHKAEMLVTIAGPDLNANETQADDSIAADTSTTITISAQPADQSGAVGETDTFSITVGASAGTITIQWQKKSGKRWVDIAGSSDLIAPGGTDSYTTPAHTAENNGDKFRAKLTSNTGAKEVISDVATLTVA